MDAYHKLEKIGEGTYGVVFKCTHIPSNTLVAMKKVRLDDDVDEGVPSTAIREISVLRELSLMVEEGMGKGQGAENIVRLLDIVHSERSKLALVFEFVDMDLKKYMDLAAVHNRQERLRFEIESGQSIPLEEEQDQFPNDALSSSRHKSRDRALPIELVKKLSYQLILGLDFLHSKRIMHRDLKPQNLLIDQVGNLKIADFGLARAFGVPLRTYTHEIVTLWYRAPEILLGTRHYSTSVDIWSIGCILAEMATGNPLLSGDSEIDQLFRTFRLLGTPNETIWPGLSKLPDWKVQFPNWHQKDLLEIMPELGSVGIDLVLRMLTFDPTRRISAKASLRHPYFESRAPSSPRPSTLQPPSSTSTRSTNYSFVSSSPSTSVQSSPLSRSRSPNHSLMASPCI